MSTPRLVTVGGSQPAREYSLDGGECLMGRALDCDITVLDHRISRRHARFLRGPDGLLRIEDLGSVNGTFLNNRRIQGQASVVDGDEIVIGSSRFRVDLGEEYIAPQSEGRVTVIDASANDSGMIEVANLRHDEALFTRRADSAADDLLREVKRLQHKLRTMYQIGEAVASALEPRALLGKVLEQLLDVMPQAASAAAAMGSGSGHELKTVAYAQRPGEAAGTQMIIPSGVIDRVLRQGHSVLLRHVTDRSSQPEGDRVSIIMGAPGDFGSVTGRRMGAPLMFKGVPLGILYVESSPDSNEFNQADLDLLGGIAAQTGVALHLAEMHQKQMIRDRIEKDLSIARQIQRNLLPREPPRVSGIEFAVHYEPAFHVGGDFFDFIWLDPTHLGLVIGDVSGKAVSGALFMARVASEFRANAPLESSPARLLRRVNRALTPVAEDGMFCTAAMLSIDLTRHVMRFSNAGHTSPLVRRGNQVITVEDDIARSVPLGVEEVLEVGEAEIALQPGDLMLLCTDGLIEAKAMDGSFYGEARLEAVMARVGGTARAVVDAVLADIDLFVGDAPQADDQTIVCLKILEASSHRSESVRPPGR